GGGTGQVGPRGRWGTGWGTVRHRGERGLPRKLPGEGDGPGAVGAPGGARGLPGAVGGASVSVGARRPVTGEARPPGRHRGRDDGAHRGPYGARRPRAARAGRPRPPAGQLVPHRGGAGASGPAGALRRRHERVGDAGAHRGRAGAGEGPHAPDDLGARRRAYGARERGRRFM
ncbi:MAG: hypothetical protein AVDCRST_MAG03-3301, partial [uncultured Rubrobacteraceae bacterium]